MSDAGESARVPYTIVVPTAYGQMLVNRHDINQTNALIKTGRPIDDDEIRLLCRLLAVCRPQPVFVDIGANFGTYSLAMAAAMGRRGKIHAFEPQRLIFNLLVGSAALNSIDTLHCYNVALGDRDGVVEVPQYDYWKPLNFGSIEFTARQREPLAQQRRHDPDDVETVPLRTLDSFAFGDVDIVKIDVEGMELEVLRGADATIRRGTPVLHIEFAKSDPQALRAWVEQLGYAVYRNAMNYICVPPRLRERIVFGK